MKRLVQLGELDAAMKLSLELMKQGSYQVEMSDEGLMSDDIEARWRPVVRGLQKSDIPAAGRSRSPNPIRTISSRAAGNWVLKCPGDETV